MNPLVEKWKELVIIANEKGIPLPMVRVKGTASLSATLVFISFNMWAVSVVGKWSGYFGGVDSSQCLQMFIACASLYWGRKLQKDEKGLSLEARETPPKSNS